MWHCTHTCIYSRRSYTKTYSLLKIGSCWETSWRGAPHWARKLAAFFFLFSGRPPSRLQKTHSPAPLHEIWNNDELYTTPAHLTCQIYAPYAAVQELLRRHTCSPQCDMAVTLHLCAPTASFCLNVLLIHSIFHVAQCLTSHCSAWQAGCIIECTLWFGSV